MKNDTLLRTTINFEADRLEYLKERCEQKSVSVSSVIKKAVKMFFDTMNKDDYEWCTVSYQKKAPRWKKFHITLKAFEYDTYLDAKKVLRLSFSFIVALAIDKFSDLILNDECVESYPLWGYSKYCIIDDNCTYYVFSWGISRNEVKITLPPEE
jgi:hypothetical protein